MRPQILLKSIPDPQSPQTMPDSIKKPSEFEQIFNGNFSIPLSCQLRGKSKLFTEHVNFFSLGINNVSAFICLLTQARKLQKVCAEEMTVGVEMNAEEVDVEVLKHCQLFLCLSL